MKKAAVFMTLTLFLTGLGTATHAQLGGLMNKVKSKIVEKALGIEGEEDQGSPGAAGKGTSCASESDQVVFEFGKNIKLAANEVTVQINDGNILLYDKLQGKYYIKKSGGGAPEGPYKGDHPAVKNFGALPSGGGWGEEELLAVYPEYISRKGDKYTLSFGGKSYGSFAGIHNFVVNDSRTGFAAMVVHDSYDGDSGMEEIAKKMENAKTDQERMQIAMAHQAIIAEKAQEISSLDMMPRLVTNLAGAREEIPMGGELSSTVKKGEIVWVTPNAVVDMTGRKLFELANLTSFYDIYNFWISDDNKQYASYDNGLLKFSDGRECSEVFSPFRDVVDGKPVIGFFYFSSAKNAIMSSSHPF